MPYIKFDNYDPFEPYYPSPSVLNEHTDPIVRALDRYDQRMYDEDYASTKACEIVIGKLLIFSCVCIIAIVITAIVINF
jgi:hypothetical protein